jgi:hypothetical protein
MQSTDEIELGINITPPIVPGSSKPVTIPEVVSKNRKRNPKKKEEEHLVV